MKRILTPARCIGITILVAALVFCCDMDHWLDRGQSKKPYPVDIYYICSTNVLSSQDEQGNEVYNATLTQAEKELLDQEINYMQGQLCDSMNWFAPHYHQYTMSAISQCADTFSRAYQIALNDVQAQLTDYLRHQNKRRPFFLVGFSQGAMFIPALLDQMRDKDYKRCLGAYMMGYRLSKEDLRLQHIEPATSATEGKLISFNTCCSADQQWNFVSEGATTCINPLNWRTDATPATLVWDNDTLTIQQDTLAHILVCNADSMRYFITELGRWIPRGCLHHWDLLWYNNAIRANMLLRAHVYYE